MDDILNMDEAAEDVDYADLVNTIERHQCTSYCLRSDKSKKQYCRFDFPFEVDSSTSTTKIEYTQ